MRFNVLGPLEVLDSNGPRAVRRGRPRVLLHLLLMHRRVVLPVEVLADRLWPDEQPLDASNAVHQLMSYLRRALGDEGRPLLVTSPTGYLLDAADEQVDARVLEQLVESVMGDLATPTAEAATRAVSGATEATRLWRGEPYTESATYAWAAGDIERLRDSYLLLQEARLDALLRLGRHREVLLEATSLVAAHPLREQLHAHLSLALYRSGRQGEALDVHRRLRAMLADELGIDPALPLQALERQILNQDPELNWRPLSGQAATVPRSPSTGPIASPPPPDLLPPAPRTPLRGREADAERVADLVRDCRLVTLVGPPGVGKTRLATEVVTRSPAAHRWFVDVSDATTGDFLTGTISSRLSIVGEPPADALEQLTSALAVDGLLVLDGCEAATGGVRSLLRHLLERTEDLRVLVTSRRPLQVPAEVIYRLEPLALPEGGSTSQVQDAPAVQLFLDRARAATGRASESAEDLALVTAIVTSLDGLPLAIELAAANADVLGLGALSDRLAGQLDYLVQPESEAPTRHRSLRSAISHSLDLLDQEEHDFFVQLAVFPGSFDLDAAGAVTGRAQPETFRLVAALVRQSLLVPDGGTGYRLLAPVRELVAELLAERTDGEEVRRRHAQHVVSVVDPLASASRRGDQEVLAVQSQHLADALAALRWALDHTEVGVAARIAAAYAWYWHVSGMTREGIRSLTEVRALLERTGADRALDAHASAYAELLRNLGLLANPVGRLELAEEACAEAADISRRLEDWDGAARALLTVGIARWARGDYDGAAAAHDEAAELADRGGSGWSRMVGLALRARTALDAGEEGVERRIDVAVEAARAVGDKVFSGLATLVQARWALLSGQLTLAEVSAQEALARWRAVGYREGEVGALNLLGRMALETTGPAAAQPLLREALQIATGTGHPGGQCESLESWAMLAAADGRFEQAYLLYCVAALERERLAAAVPAADRPRLAALEKSCTGVLGGAAERVRARARVLDFADVRGDLLAPDEDGRVRRP